MDIFAFSEKVMCGVNRPILGLGIKYQSREISHGLLRDSN